MPSSRRSRYTGVWLITSSGLRLRRVDPHPIALAHDKQRSPDAKIGLSVAAEALVDGKSPEQGAVGVTGIGAVLFDDLEARLADELHVVGMPEAVLVV